MWAYALGSCIFMKSNSDTLYSFKQSDRFKHGVKHKNSSIKSYTGKKEKKKSGWSEDIEKTT